MAVVVALLVFKLPIKAWTAHRTEKFRVPLLTTELSSLLSFGTRSKFLMQICSGPFSVAISNWPSFVGSKSFHSSHDSATSSKVSGVRRVPSRGTEQNFMRRSSAPRFNSLYYPFIYHLWQKRLPLLNTVCWQMVPLLHTYVLKVMLHQTMLACQRCCDIVSNGYNIVPTFQRCVALKIVVANCPV